MKLIVGLGNPGKEYALSRHNIGFRCVSRFVRRHRLAFSRRECGARLAEGEIAGEPVVLAKPQTFMNRSGDAVGCLVKKLSLPLSQLLVVYDDMDLSVGSLRLRPGGSAGGHHGMESIIAALGSQDFPRLRLGIGRGEGIPFVLGQFSPQEASLMEEAIDLAVAAVEVWLTEGIEAAMNLFNAPSPPVPPLPQGRGGKK